MSYAYPYFGSNVLQAARLIDPDHYDSFFNAQLSQKRRHWLHTAYLAYKNDTEIGLVWSARQAWIHEKTWHWVSPRLGVSRRPYRTLYGALYALERNNEAHGRRQARQEARERELGRALDHISFRF
jgi:hypothetical protein